MRLNLKAGVEDQTVIGQRIGCAPRNGARVKRRCCAVLMIDIGLNPRRVIQPVKHEEPVWIGHQDDIAKPGQPGKPGYFILPDGQYCAVRQVLQQQTGRCHHATGKQRLDLAGGK